MVISSADSCYIRKKLNYGFFQGLMTFEIYKNIEQKFDLIIIVNHTVTESIYKLTIIKYSPQIITNSGCIVGVQTNICVWNKLTLWMKVKSIKNLYETNEKIK